MAANTHVLDDLIVGLPTVNKHHGTMTEVYQLLKRLAKKEVAASFSGDAKVTRPLGPFGEIIFPYHQMGAIDSLDLFGLDELIIFSFYWVNRHRYKRVLDIGGNLGLHAILMSRCGYDVVVYEPDPRHFEILSENLQLNHSTNVRPVNAAVSTRSGTAEFVRVLGNTTSSHLEGARSPYGPVEKFTVPVANIKDLLKGIDLMKMDVEGHEKDLILATDAEDWMTLDAMIAVGSPANAVAIFEHLNKLKVNAFAQKNGWSKIQALDDMPTSHRDGSLFISMKNQMFWN